MTTEPREQPAAADPEARETRVLEAVVSLVDSLLDDFDVVELLSDLTEQCASLLDVTSAGLLLAGPDRELRLVTATTARTTDLELFQLQAREGPCLDCFRTGRPVSADDLRDVADRWPAFVAAARATGFASVHAVPMRAAGVVLGALGLFGTTPGRLRSADLAVGQALAHVASVAILQEQAPTAGVIRPRLQNVLDRQVVVEQAKGFVRDRLDVPFDETAGLLRAYASGEGRHLSDVCRALMSDRARRPAILAALRAMRAAHAR